MMTARTSVAMVAVVAVLPAPGIAAAARNAPQPSKARTVTVTASSTVKAEPDRVRLGFEVETRAATAAAAAAENAERSASVLAVLEKAVRPPGRVTTAAYQLNPEYSYRDREGNRRRVLVGYTAVNRFDVVSADLEGTGRLIDRAVAAGAGGAGAVTFFREDLSAARRQALLEAGQRARSEAEAIAESLGISLGEVVTASSGVSTPLPPQPRVMALREANTQAAPTPIQPGEIAVTVTVTVVFAIRGT